MGLAASGTAAWAAAAWAAGRRQRGSQDISSADVDRLRLCDKIRSLPSAVSLCCQREKLFFDNLVVTSQIQWI